MAQVTIWLPDDLYQEVQRRKEAGQPINVSALATEAVRSAILGDGSAALAAAEDAALRTHLGLEGRRRNALRRSAPP